MRDTGLKVGRRKATGFRVISADSRTDLSQLLAGLGGTDSRVARDLLRRAVRSYGPHGIRVQPAQAPMAFELARAGVVACEEKAVGSAAEPRWIPWRLGLVPDAVSEAKEALGWLNADFERTALLAEIEDSERAALEAQLLKEVAGGAPLGVPQGSQCSSRSWSVYSAALRGLAEWERLQEHGVKPSSREVAARALGSSKAWTPARIRAFEQLAGMPFDEAMNHVEPVVKFRGPIKWAYRGAVGDGLSAHPWVGLPASMLGDLELLEANIEAVLVIENEKTFEEVIRRTTVSESALILYGGGFLGEAEIDLLRLLDRPIWAWGDLDPKGIQIVCDIAARTGLDVRPLLMEGHWLEKAPGRQATPEQVALAASLAGQSLEPPLQGLAAAIAASGRVVEQEAMHHAIERVQTAMGRVAISPPMG